ncbi:hypothetical protein MBLNU459_g5843t1 [Dothideomycetes sp. NU459]
MDDNVEILLFGDQTNSFDHSLRKLLQTKDNSALTTFLERVSFALRLEISGLSSTKQQNFPHFTSALELLTRYRDFPKHPALESAFHCLNQLGWFVCHYVDGSKLFPTPRNTRILGVCTGLIAAAAVSTSRTIAELIPAAVEAVLIAFRSGLHAKDMSCNIVGLEDSSTESWSAVVGMQEKEVRTSIETFLQAKTLPRLSQPYVSAIATNNVTVSGPPASLDQFLASDALSCSKAVKSSVFAPYHAHHIYRSTDVDTILPRREPDNDGQCRDAIPLFSNATGRLITMSDYQSVLRAVLLEILTEPIRWNLLIESVAREVEMHLVSRCKILPFGANGSQSLFSALSLSGSTDVTIAEDVCGDRNQSRPQRALGRSEQSKIAIIGYSGRYPDAASNEKFWEILHQGRDVHRAIPPDRFDVKAHMDPTGKKKNTSRIGHGCFIEEPGLFDERFFNMSPREAANSDPGQRLAITTAYEAMEMAGFVTGRTPSTQKDRVGIFYGMTSDDWREVNSGQNIDTYFIPGGNRAFTPGRLNYFFKFSGPSFSVDTACSSSFAAIHAACNSLWRGDCDSAFAGGTNVMTNPDNFAGLDRGHFLSTTGSCNTFDDGANGYCRADGVGTILLKRLEDAQADGDPIQGVLLGAYTNHSADAESMTRPHVGAQAFIFEKMLSSNNVDPLDVSYIEMHGTGTQAGDATEMGSVLKVFAPATGKRPGRPLYLGSAKSNVGHAESSSGVLSLIKVLMMMRNNEIPPHCGIKTKINHRFPTDLDARNVRIASKLVSWRRPESGVRRTFLNNFSAAGGNTALLLEDAPLPSSSAETNELRGYYIVAVSGKSASSLKKNAASLAAFITDSPEVSLPALSYTTTARRIQHNFRAMATGADMHSIVQQLRDVSTVDSPKAVPAKPGKVAFVFTGQGTLQTGMGKQLFQTCSHFRASLQNFDQIAQRQGFPSFLGLIDGSLEDVPSIDPLVAQLGTTCLQMALCKLWASWGIVPELVIGHSLGEYAGLFATGILSASNAIFLAGARAQLLIDRCTAGTHAMLAIKMSFDEFRTKWPSTSCEVACINGPSEIVLSGTNECINDVANIVSSSGTKFSKLTVPFAFHSSQVEPILGDFEVAASSVEFGKPLVPYVSPLLRDVVTEEGIIGARYLSRACRSTVDFSGAVTTATDAGVVTEKTTWIEIGSHPICSGLLRQICGTSVCALPSMRRGEDAWKTLTGSLMSLYSRGASVDWTEYHRDDNPQQVLRLPSYQWDSKNHWIQYKNNFCLTKGDVPAEAPPQIAALPRDYTSAVQQIIEQQLEGQRPSIIMQSDLANPELATVVSSHKVNGVALCPSSLYADIALTLGNFLLEESASTPGKFGLDVAEMVVDKPLIATGGRQLFRASAHADWSAKTIAIAYYSVSADGKKTVDHAHCTVKLGETDKWRKEWKRVEYMITSRIESLRNGVSNGSTHLIKRKMAYKLFSSVVEYDTKYRGMEEVMLDSDNHEASASVMFQSTKADGNYHFSPFWIDSFGHLAGFVMNANDSIDSKVQVFVNHGWDSMRCAQEFSADKSYRTYVRMQNVGGTMYAGDVYILLEDEIVGVYTGVKFQGVPRRALDALLPAARSAKIVSKPLTTLTSRIAAMPLQPEKRTGRAMAHGSPEPRVTSVATAILTLIAEETGVALSDLQPSVAFDDIGLDSLLALNITGRIREELQLEIENSLFADHSTVESLTRHFTGAQTDVDTDSRTSANSTSESQSGGIMIYMRQILAQEIGVKEKEIEGSTDFGELGLDSLLSLTVLSQLREAIDIELPSDLFATCSCLDAVALHLGLNSTEKRVSHHTVLDMDHLNQRLRMEENTTALVGLSKAIPSATSVLLQGSSRTCSKRLFLFPDGSGNSASYASLPNVGSDVAVYGLNCPYMRNPEEMKCRLDELTAPYLAEIRRRQPRGPYYLGGWSAGGICAYDAAQELSRAGEEVARLLLLDSPFPIGLEKLPPRLYDFFNTCGLFGQGGRAPPKWLLPHFLAFIDALDTYRAVPFEGGKRPKVFLIWAEEGVCNKPDSPRPDLRVDDPKEMKWLLNNRTNLGPNGWDFLVGGDNLVISSMKGANHFTMMEGENGRELIEFIRLAME